MALEEVSRSPLDLHMGVLLRALVPYRRLSQQEALFYAEQQATMFLKLVHVLEPPVPVERLVPEVDLAAAIRDDPKQLPLGISTLDATSQDWVITLSPSLAAANRPFVVAHEVKHILDDGFGKVLYRPVDVMTCEQRKEYAADYFAVCLIMPRLWLERYWRRGARNTKELAGRFRTSPACMQLRLEALGLLEAEDEGAGLVGASD